MSRPNDALFVAQEIYDWRMLDELGVSAYWVGDYTTGKLACETVLARVEEGLASIAEGDLRRIKENLAYSANKLKG
jgi:hypothetical protein